MRVVMVTSPCTPSPLLWLVQLLLWFHNHGPQLTEAAPPCPTPCTCSNQASRVICTRKSLDQVPESISENTRYLNLQENTIQVNITLHFYMQTLNSACIVTHFIYVDGSNSGVATMRLPVLFVCLFSTLGDQV